MLSEDDLSRLIGLISDTNPAEPLTSLRAVQGNLGPRGIHERIALIAAALRDDIEPSLDVTATYLLDSNDFAGWMTLAVSDALVTREIPDLDTTLELLRRLTPRLSSEFAMRKLIASKQDDVWPTVLRWTQDADPDVRRLASECTRPRLPWAMRLDHLAKGERYSGPILDALHNDTSDFVRRSVANHLNDISKINPELALRFARRWAVDGSAQSRKLIRLGLRTLIKEANLDALAMVGVEGSRRLSISGPVVERKSIRLGESLGFSYAVTNEESTPTTVVIDYVIHFMKANGRTRPKTFKLSTRTLDSGETWTGRREHGIVPLSTRKYYPGIHSVELRVNGNATVAQPFSLEVPDPDPR
ncbi:DNA alkylation repair protein [Paeniglutamicibacter kerguelensis]